MDLNKVKELLPILQAFAEGKTIQRYDSDREISSLAQWHDTADITGKGKYRIKPKPREFLINLGSLNSFSAIPYKEGQDWPYPSTDWIKVQEVLQEEKEKE